MEDPALAAELIARMNVDAEARGAAERAFGPDGICRDQAIAHRISEVDRDNTAWIRGVLEAGWPGWKRVGEVGALAAWLLCQHADRDPELQHRALSLLEEAVATGDAAARELAYLTDRVLVAEGRLQRFGTQFQPPGGKLEPFPLWEPEGLDQRRAAMGLESRGIQAWLLVRIRREPRQLDASAGAANSIGAPRATTSTGQFASSICFSPATRLSVHREAVVVRFSGARFVRPLSDAPTAGVVSKLNWDEDIRVRLCSGPPRVSRRDEVILDANTHRLPVTARIE